MVNTDLDKVYQVIAQVNQFITNTQSVIASTILGPQIEKNGVIPSVIAMTAQNGTQTTAPSYLL